MRMSLKIVVVLACFAALSCAQSTPSQANQPALNSTPKPYIIGHRDVLSVKVSNNRNLTGEFDVRSDGMISMPLVGEVRAEGLTPMQLQEAITERLRNPVKGSK